MSYSLANPWTNYVPYSDGSGKYQIDIHKLSHKVQQDFQEFYQVLQTGLSVKLTSKNLGFIAGFASQGYNENEWNSIISDVSNWCDDMDTINPDGWLCVTNGDGYYGHYSITEIADYISSREVPIVFLQSHFGHCLPDSAYWPKNASAGLFGPGQYTTDKGKITPCWGGYVRYDPSGTMLDSRTGELSFPDAAMTQLSVDGVRLVDHLCGVLIVGGGNICREQAEILEFLTIHGSRLPKRQLDRYISANTKIDLVTGNISSSPLNAIYGGTSKKYHKLGVL